MVHLGELRHRALRQITLSVIHAAVLQHQEDGTDFFRRGEQTRVTGVAVHQRGGLVVDITMDQLLAERPVLFRRGDLLLVESMLQRFERRVRQSHRLIERFG